MTSTRSPTDPLQHSHHISTLIFIKDRKARFLLLQRKNSPNMGKWSPVGGKLKIDLGESPFECAIRETREETGLGVSEDDLHLFAYVAEKYYEGEGHWFMFLFACKKAIDSLPPAGKEGKFSFFTRTEIESLSVPTSDRILIWPLYDQFRKFGFAAVRADCTIPNNPIITIEESMQRTNIQE